MRTPVQLRVQALAGASASVAFALLAAYIAFVLLGREGRLSFEAFNAAGLLEGVVFVLGFTGALRFARSALRMPSPSLLSFGLVAPPRAGRVARAVPVVEAADLAQTLAENRIIIVQEGGVPVGVSGVRRERLLPWEELVKVDGGIAVTDLRRVLAHERVVVVTEGERISGIITQDMYLSGTWGTLR